MINLPREKKIEMTKVFLGGLAVALLLAGMLWNTHFSARAHVTEIELLSSLISQANGNLSRLNELRSHSANEDRNIRILESKMASGDLYLWVMKALKPYAEDHRIVIERYGNPVLYDEDYHPVLPYRQACFVVEGRAYYHDIGKFTAAIENAFPFLKVSLISMNSAPNEYAGEEDAETLSFEMVFVTTVSSKPIFREED